MNGTTPSRIQPHPGLSVDALLKSHKSSPTSQPNDELYYTTNIIQAITRSSNGACKYLYEVCDQLKLEKPTIDYTQKIVDKQPCFTATLKIKGYSASQDARSKQEAKNAAALDLLKQLAQSNRIAEGIIRMVILKDKQIADSLLQTPIVDEHSVKAFPSEYCG